MPLWFDHFLKGSPALPETPRIELTLAPEPALRVTAAKHAWPAARCDIYYSIDSDPRARFWRSAEVTREGDVFTAKLPLHSRDTPLFAFANVHHTLPKPESLAQIPGTREPVTELCLSSLLHTHSADELKKANIALTAKPTTLFDDFTHGLRDWYVLNEGNLTYQELWTRKVTDPLWRGAQGSKLNSRSKFPQTNRMSFVLLQNEWRSYRGPRKTFVHTSDIPGAATEQSLVLEAKDFTSPDGAPASWAEIDQLGLCAHFVEHGSAANNVPVWKGTAPEFVRLEWV